MVRSWITENSGENERRQARLAGESNDDGSTEDT
jgi:hypothetical protein